MNEQVGKGGFFYPKVYRQSKDYVTRNFEEGRIDHADFSFWTFADHFIAYLLGAKFFEFADETYPTPRKKTEVPIWFLISCQLVMRITVNKSYKKLNNLMLNAGPVLLRMGFNVASTALGFNDKNKSDRDTACDFDTVRKFFKDSRKEDIRDWYNVAVQNWFRQQKYFDAKGIYILDQSHCVVPENKNYKDAVKMPVDEHGQLYKNLGNLSEEEKKGLKYHPCYSLSTLLHLSYSSKSFHIAGYEWGKGNEDELPQAMRIIKKFHETNKVGTIKLLVLDRGYVSGEFITELKLKYKIDVLLPLKQNMDQYQDSLVLSKEEGTKWESYEECDEISGKTIAIHKVCTLEDVCLWDKCKVKLFTTVIEKNFLDNEERWQTSTFVLCSTKKFKRILNIPKIYEQRTQIEERFKQFKNYWEIANFPSPDDSLIEAQVSFTLLAYSLIQSYLLRSDLQKHANKTITTLKGEDSLGINNLVTYVDDRYAVYDTKEALGIVNNLKTLEARERLQGWIDKK